MKLYKIDQKLDHYALKHYKDNGFVTLWDVEDFKIVCYDQILTPVSLVVGLRDVCFKAFYLNPGTDIFIVFCFYLYFFFFTVLSFVKITVALIITTLLSIHDSSHDFKKCIYILRSRFLECVI